LSCSLMLRAALLYSRHSSGQACRSCKLQTADLTPYRQLTRDGCATACRLAKMALTRLVGLQRASFSCADRR
jgi:hypothetical protein